MKGKQELRPEMSSDKRTVLVFRGLLWLEYRYNENMEAQNITKQDYPKLLEFLNQQLRPHVEWSIEAEYPQVFKAHNQSRMMVVKNSEGEILSHALYKVLPIKSIYGMIKVAAIGSVVTHAKHRGKGYSRKVVQACVDRAKSEGCELSILWSDLFDFYKAMNFYKTGYEYAFMVDRPLTETKNHFHVGANVSASTIENLYRKQSFQVLRKTVDFEANLKIPKSYVYTLWDKNNKLLSYAIEGKGVDFTGYIHEWGGGVSSIKELLTHIYNYRQQNLTLIVPGHSVNLRKDLKSLGIKNHLGILGLVKLLGLESLTAKINLYCKRLDYAVEFEATDNQSLVIRSGEEKVLLTGEEVILQTLFGPHELLGDKALNNFLQSKLKNILPLPLWVWGWDSI